MEINREYYAVVLNGAICGGRDGGLLCGENYDYLKEQMDMFEPDRHGRVIMADGSKPVIGIQKVVIKQLTP